MKLAVLLLLLLGPVLSLASADKESSVRMIVSGELQCCTGLLTDAALPLFSL